MLNVSRGAVRSLAALTVFTGAVASQAVAHAQYSKLAAAAPVTYGNRYEVYGGIAFMDFQAGQNLPRRMNLGGVEASATYWVTPKLGVTGDFRGDAGTSHVLPNPYFNGLALVVLYTGMGGVTYRGPRNQRFAVDYHALAGGSYGDFTETKGSSPLFTTAESGFYNNHTAPMYAVGGSLDFNRTKNLAIRLSPDLIVENFGTENRVFFHISAGVVYRIGKR